MSKNGTRRLVNFWIDKTKDEELNHLALDEDCAKSALIREAINSLLLNRNIRRVLRPGMMSICGKGEASRWEETLKMRSEND